MARILLGANYYPEDRDESLMDFDIEKALECENAFDENRYWRAMEMSL